MSEPELVREFIENSPYRMQMELAVIHYNGLPNLLLDLLKKSLYCNIDHTTISNYINKLYIF